MLTRLATIPACLPRIAATMFFFSSSRRHTIFDCDWSSDVCSSDLFVGSGFNARFHLQGLQAVRDADVLGVWSPNGKHAEDMAAQARRLDLGPAKAHRSIAEMVADPGVDALWLCGPNQARVENVEEIVDAMTRGKGTLKGVACEKPLARNVAEAVRVTEMVKKAGL